MRRDPRQVLAGAPVGTYVDKRWANALQRDFLRNRVDMKIAPEYIPVTRRAALPRRDDAPVEAPHFSK